MSIPISCAHYNKFLWGKTVLSDRYNQIESKEYKIFGVNKPFQLVWLIFNNNLSSNVSVDQTLAKYVAVVSFMLE